jgi:hypothetical protein
MCSSAPDTSKADAVAAKVQGLSEDQWNWVKQQYAAEAPDRAAASQTARDVSGRQMALMDQQLALGNEAANDYRTIYKPLEAGLVNKAASYDTEAHREDLAGKARTDVEVQAQGQRDATERNMASMGVNVSDPAYASIQEGLGRDTALAKVAAGNKARTDAETMGHALTMDAIGVGRGVVGSQATSTGLALNAGNSASQNGVTPVSIGQSGVGMVQGAANNAISGLGTAGNLYLNSANLNNQASQSNSQGTGALAGAAMTAAALF